MDLLLDTQIFLWSVEDNRRLSAEARRVIRAARRVHVSSASIWEIAIKAGLGKLKGDPRQLAAAIEPSGFHELPVSAVHAAAVHGLPMHHKDPFDRLLVAQAISEPLHLLSADEQLAAYSELVLLV